MVVLEAGYAGGGGGLVWEWSGHVQPALVASLVLLFCLEACLWVRNLRPKRPQLPGPFPWPLVGNAMQLGAMPHMTFAKLARKYGSVFQIRLGSSDVVVLNGDATIRKALLQHGVAFAGRPDFASFRVVSGGRSMVFGCYSQQWRQHRKVAHSTLRAFSSANSSTRKAFEQHVVAEASELVHSLLHLSQDGRYFDPSHEFTIAAANVICALCFGERYGHDDPEFRALLSKLDKFGETVGAGSLVDVMPWLQHFPNPLRSLFQNFKSLNHEFFTFITQKVSQHRVTFDPEVTRDISDAIINVIEYGEGSTLTKDFVEGTVTDLVGAGQDTVSTALTWILLLLVKHPHHQRNLQDLLDRVVGRGRLPSLEDRRQLAPLDAFIYETMRFTSFVPFTIPHATTADVTLQGLHIPKDTVVFINQWSVNHDPRKWQEPHVFNPARFLDADGQLDRDVASGVMIFSVGARRCIGTQVAQVELFLFTAILLHQCSLQCNPATPLTLDSAYGLSLKPLPFTITATSRDMHKDTCCTS